ncbi:protein kinase domain-containing protein [Parafrankia elaeagni]|uniref:protein kinase domain-containing protein n=1 Tax=Parafrankia elaeagni TaxID=222534 RepID=UPI00037C1490|nr:protein kinase [Parafrankia elaeagni]
MDAATPAPKVDVIVDHNGEHAPAARGQPGSGMPPGEVLHPHEPRVIGPYRLLRRLGAGGMGTVYLAESAGRRVAVKIVRPDLAADEEFRRRFRQEVDAARRVAPFCTAEVLDADPDAPAPYLVTEFIDGVRLDHAVENGPIGGSTLTGLAVGVATALTAIHSAGLVHRDLKPSNVLLSMSGPRVIDFGIAQALEGAKAKPTAWGFGSAGWMAPEQVNGQPIGPEADVFTWGILVAFAGTGHHPFGTGTDLELSTRIVSWEPDLLGLPPGLKTLVAAALAKNPDARPNARDLLLNLIALPPTTPSADSGDGAAWRPSDAAVDQAEELLNLTRGSTLPGYASSRAQSARQLRQPAAVPPAAGPPAAGPPAQVRPPGQGGPRGRGDAAAPGAGPGHATPGRPGIAVPTPAGAPPFSGAPAGAGPPSAGWPAARPPGQGPPPPPPAADTGTQAPSRSTRQRLLLFGAVAVTAILAAWLISAVTGGDSGSGRPAAGGQAPPAEATTDPRTAGLGTPVRDDQLEFVATKVECGVEKMGEMIFTRRPAGQFCLADMRITNTGSVERALSSEDQFLVTTDGENHSADFLARLYLRDDVWSTIGPGVTVTGTFAFDIPADSEARALELHERPESRGVTITL